MMMNRTKHHNLENSSLIVSACQCPRKKGSQLKSTLRFSTKMNGPYRIFGCCLEHILEACNGDSLRASHWARAFSSWGLPGSPLH